MAEVQNIDPRYKIEKLIKKNNTLHVQSYIYVVFDQQDKVKKVLKKYEYNDKQFEQDLSKEANNQQKLSEQDGNLFCKVFEHGQKNVGQLKFVYFIVMEYCEFGDLDQEISRRKKTRSYFTEKEVDDFIQNTIKIGAIMEKQGIAHRDIKPKNFFMDNKKNFKLGDFGEVTELLNNENTKERTLRGTPIYLSPLLFNCYSLITQGNALTQNPKYNPYKSDVFSLGVTFVELMTLEDPLGLNTKSSQIKIDLKIKQIESIYNTKKYTILLKNMLEYEEQKRPDFLQLEEKLNNNEL